MRKSQDRLHIKDVEDSEDNDEHESAEEIEEDIEIVDTSLDMRDSNVLDSVPQLRGSYVIHDDAADEAWKSARPVIETDKNEEDTIVLSFSKSKLWVKEAYLVPWSWSSLGRGGG